MFRVLHAFRLICRYAPAGALSVALVLAAVAVSADRAQFLVGSARGAAFCNDADLASAAGLEAISKQVESFASTVVAQAEEADREARAQLDAAQRAVDRAASVLGGRQRELARLEQAWREGADRVPGGLELLAAAEIERDRAEEALARRTGLMEKVARLSRELDQLNADPPSSPSRLLEVTRELGLAERAVSADVSASGLSIFQLLTRAENARARLKGERLRHAPALAAADAAVESARTIHGAARTDLVSKHEDSASAAVMANRARANRDMALACIVKNRERLRASGAGAPPPEPPPPPTGPPLPPTAPAAPAAPGPRSDFATHFFMTRFGWQPGLPSVRAVEAHIGGFLFHPDGTVTGYLMNAGSLKGTWKGTSASGTLKLSGAAPLEGEWRLTGLAFGSDALGGPIATAGHGSWCAGQLKGLHYFGGIVPTATSFPTGKETKPKPGKNPAPADAEAMCPTGTVEFGG